jgi:hypothetical protein
VHELKGRMSQDWIEEGEKYTLIGMSVKLDGHIPLTQLTPHHWVQADPGFRSPLTRRRAPRD